MNLAWVTEFMEAEPGGSLIKYEIDSGIVDLARGSSVCWTCCYGYVAYVL